MIIAVDGPAAAGKGTLTRRLSDHYHLPRLDTGLLYRTVAATLLAEGLDPRDEAQAARTARSLDLSRFRDADLRTRGVGEAASVVAVQQPGAPMRCSCSSAPSPTARPAPFSTGATSARWYARTRT